MGEIKKCSMVRDCGIWIMNCGLGIMEYELWIMSYGAA